MSESLTIGAQSFPQRKSFRGEKFPIGKSEYEKKGNTIRILSLQYQGFKN